MYACSCEPSSLYLDTSPIQLATYPYDLVKWNHLLKGFVPKHSHTGRQDFNVTMDFGKHSAHNRGKGIEFLQRWREIHLFPAFLMYSFSFFSAEEKWCLIFTTGQRLLFPTPGIRHFQCDDFFFFFSFLPHKTASDQLCFCKLGFDNWHTIDFFSHLFNFIVWPFVTNCF